MSLDMHAMIRFPQLKIFVIVLHVLFLHSCDIFWSEGLQMPGMFIDQIVNWGRVEGTLGGQGWMLGHEEDGSVPRNNVKTPPLYRSGSQATVNAQVMTL